MPEIRPLSPDDLPAVSRLLDDQMPLWEASPGFLARSLIEDPWNDPALGSLVAVDESGDLVGFIGGQVRRLRLEDRELRGVCASPVVVSGDGRAGAAGALLLGRLIKGPQDLTWSDTATEVVARVWHTYGGHDDHTRAADWRLVLRPGRWLGDRASAALRSRLRRRADDQAAARAPAAAPSRSESSLPRSIQDVSTAVSAGGATTDHAVEARDAGPAEIAEALPQLGRGIGLYVDYDAGHLEHALALIADNPNTTGRVVARIVHRRGRPIGWYLYLPAATGLSRVLHLTASKPAEIAAVFGELVDHAREQGCVVLGGRVEPHLVHHLRTEPVLIGLARRPIFHASDPKLRATLATRESLLTRLDGEWFAP